MTSRPWTFRASAIVVALAAATATLSATAVAQGGAKAPAAHVVRHDPQPAGSREHNLDGPLSRTRAAQREEALNRVISGKATVTDRGASKVVKLSSGKYVELARERTDKIFTILAEFGTKTSQYGGTAGPEHNRIAAPDRTKDNSTAWQSDYNRQHFQDLYFSTDPKRNSLKQFYEKASSGRYSVDGQVQDWVKVDYNEARYGSNQCDTCVWNLIGDALTKWVAQRKAAGDTDAQIKARIAQYDQWDRYDYDGDGNFNEPDGYIDHFQIVHAGEDESAGGGAQGEDAIWAHRWYAYGTDAGRTGPDTNKLGGTQIGDTGVWVGDYTVQPENGGLGVFAHEYGHDLGLPDNYDTTGNADNSTGFWDLMSSGSWLGTGKNSIGDTPGDFTAWDKLQLGWLNYRTVTSRATSLTKIGYSEFNTKDPQAVLVTLPKKTVTTELIPPASGSYQWWSGSGNGLNNTLTRDVDLTGKSSAALSLKGYYDIEQNYDFLYTEVSADGGATWKPVDGTVNGAAIPRDASDQPALTGTLDGYADLVYPLDAYAGQKIKLRFRYTTDTGVAKKGFTADDLAVTADGSAVFSDGAENGTGDWAVNGFSVKGASYSGDYPQYYIAENRQYVSYDSTLKTGPYNFGFLNTKPNWVEHYPYQNGLLVWYWDTSQADNNVSEHPGQGLILPVDAHAKPLKWTDGTYLRTRMQGFDSTFTLEPTDTITLHNNSVATKIRSQAGVPVFDDHKGTYYYSATPYASVKVPDTHTRIRLLRQTKNGSVLTVAVQPSR
ncbi:immune inhibitor A domain-containing protein [Streptomyces gibsoniae]|uniref:Immune inhibitor A n=1 Tax=Streptomyces gibsoniae TaxID=3075529 RepID=A0ABU2TNC5_9ACTN|nr:immune inhibitor A domain-containing protein [Streptomyces sp. DSM 41699]MDT0462417.1 immune inhibitor A [Streptomyces sp. DSM 41699]